MIARPWFLVAALCTALVPTLATAQTAEEHMEAGLEARREHRDAEAAEHFRSAYQADRSPRALAQLALAEQALGRWIAAESSLVQALTREDEWIARHREVLDGALITIRTHLGELLVESNVEGAELSVDGRTAGSLPLAAPLRAEVGTVVVELRADGYVTVQRRAEISASSLARVHVELVAAAADPSDPESSTDPVSVPEREHSTLDDPEPDPDPVLGPTAQPGPSPFLFLGIAAGAVAVATLALTFAALGVREDNVLHWNDGTRCPADPMLGRLAECADVYSTWRSAEDWAIAGAVTTGILAALSATFFGLGSTDGGAAEVSFDLGPERIGATYRVAF